MFVGNGVKAVVVYPNCADTACYLKQKYQPNHVVEYLYKNSRLRYKRIMDKTDAWIINEYVYNDKGKAVHVTDTAADVLPEYAYSINDTMQLQLRYRQDGGIALCSYNYRRNKECEHNLEPMWAVLYDSAYQRKTLGTMMVLCDSNYVTDAQTNEEFLKIVHREGMQGKWIRYDLRNYKLDSTIHNDLLLPNKN
jgi:hypothetical protein